MLEVDVLVVVVVVVAVDPVVDVRHCIEDGERHAGEHQGDKLAEEELVKLIMTLLLFFSIIIMSKKYILLMKNGLHLCEFCPRSRLTSRTDSTTKRKVKHCWRRALLNWIIRIFWQEVKSILCLQMCNLHGDRLQGGVGCLPEDQGEGGEAKSLDKIQDHHF